MGSPNEDGSYDYYREAGSSTYSYSILTNGGVSYCAKSGSSSSESGGVGSDYVYTTSTTFGYPTSGKYCYTGYANGSVVASGCGCSDSGDPKENGSYCE